MRDTSITQRQQDGDVVLGEDWVTPEQSVTREMQVKRARRGLFSLKGSPLTRKIITFNLIALIILVAGILYLNSSRQSLVHQRAGTLVVRGDAGGKCYLKRRCLPQVPSALRQGTEFRSKTRWRASVCAAGSKPLYSTRRAI